MSIYRQKLVNAVLFFAKETRHTNVTKLMKLLNFFEFEHFNETGYPSIGLEYFAFENGPVPKNFWLEIKDGTLPDDLKDKVAVSVREWGEGKKETEFAAKTSALVDFAVFTPREKRILEKLAFIYKEANAKDMSKISHEDNMPWEKTIKEKGPYEYIDYILALNDGSPISTEEAQENLRDYFQFLKTFDVSPTK